ncbi:nuclease-related domain-containing protein [Thermodesulfobacterium hveragerdense]|uniref:nuclease-related domain-containing protein n=1 Tax=Thermodesulfobacterium hveragerdense TaxID=53424 RepID=UPI000A00591F
MFGVPLNHLGDIDCFLVGPKGAFIIEAKNHKGFIRYTEGGWDHIKIGRKGTAYRGNIGNISAQISKQLNHLKHEVPTLSNVYIHKIICFTNPEAELIVEKEPKNLTVCKLENLKDCILNSKGHLKENEVKK